MGQLDTGVTFVKKIGILPDLINVIVQQKKTIYFNHTNNYIIIPLLMLVE